MKEMFDLLNLNITDFIFQLLNVGILVFFLRKFFFFFLMAVIDERNKEVNEVYQDIDDAWKDVKHQEAKYSDLLQHAEEKKQEILAQARTDSQRLKESAEAEVKRRSEEEVARARSIIESEKQAAMEAVIAKASDLVIQGAEAVLRKEISKEDHQPLLEDLIAEIGGSDARL